MQHRRYISSPFTASLNYHKPHSLGKPQYRRLKKTTFKKLHQKQRNTASPRTLTPPSLLVETHYNLNNFFFSLSTIKLSKIQIMVLIYCCWLKHLKLENEVQIILHLQTEFLVFSRPKITLQFAGCLFAVYFSWDLLSCLMLVSSSASPPVTDFVTFFLSSYH